MHAISFAGLPADAQLTYRANHSEIRAFGRGVEGDKRTARIAVACRDREFWFTTPCSEPARAALLVLNGSMRYDPYPDIAECVKYGLTNEQRKCFSIVRRAVVSGYRMNLPK